MPDLRLDPTAQPGRLLPCGWLPATLARVALIEDAGLLRNGVLTRWRAAHPSPAWPVPCQEQPAVFTPPSVPPRDPSDVPPPAAPVALPERCPRCGYRYTEDLWARDREHAIRYHTRSHHWATDTTDDELLLTHLSHDLADLARVCSRVYAYCWEAATRGLADRVRPRLWPPGFAAQLDRDVLTPTAARTQPQPAPEPPR